jgi:hypothetical protein
MSLKRKSWLRKRRGQAMVSYAIITGLLLGAGFVMSIKMLPAMLEAYNSFTQSLYFCINMPIP